MTREEIKRRFPKASEAFIRANADGGSVIGPWFKGPKEKPRIRQASRGPNKTELAFAADLGRSHPDAEIHAQAISFRLANGASYRPDIVCIPPSGFWAVYEVKGFKREASIVRLKVAADRYRLCYFYLVSRLGSLSRGQWKIERVLP